MQTGIHPFSTEIALTGAVAIAAIEAANVNTLYLELSDNGVSHHNPQPRKRHHAEDNLTSVHLINLRPNVEKDITDHFYLMDVQGNNNNKSSRGDRQQRNPLRIG